MRSCLVACLVLVFASSALAEIRFDTKKGVIGSTNEKRAWLNEIARRSLSGQQRDQALRQIAGMNGGQINALANSTYLRQLQQQQLRHNPRLPAVGQPWGGGRVVGYQPVITWLPQGTNFGTSGVISPDGRYVRVSPRPVFSSIPEVNTFNYVTGQTNGYPAYSGYPTYRYPSYQPGLYPTKKAQFSNNAPSAYAKPWHDGLRTRYDRAPHPRRPN